VFKPLKFRSPKTWKCRAFKIERFNLKQPNPKPEFQKIQVKPQEDEGKSPKALPTAWTYVPSQLNQVETKFIFFNKHFKSKIWCQSKFGFFSESLQIKSYFPWLDLMLSAS